VNPGKGLFGALPGVVFKIGARRQNHRDCLRQSRRIFPRAGGPR
jgi:hypothetical protein